VWPYLKAGVHSEWHPTPNAVSRDNCRKIPISLNTLSAGVAREREVGEAIIIKPGGNDAESESWGLEDLFERAQISRQTWMPNLMERESTRRVENGAAHPICVSNTVGSKR